ncbi:MAG: metallophosphoesterase [Erysipelotrichaceae bacterium]|nr:metallophosphoesterase [Erysipelotrichaceae bacterium]
MKFLHISDLHKLNDYTDKGGIYHNILERMSDPFVQLKKLLRNRDDVFDFVIVSGDICEYGDAEDYLSVKKHLECLFSCPVFVCSGNHDNKEKLIQVFGKKTVQGELFEEILLDEIRIILFDSSHPEYNDGYISGQTCTLLKEALERECSLPTIAVTHHHLLKEQFAMPCAAYPKEFQDIVAGSDLLAILTGHTHHIYHGTFAGKEYHTTGSLSFAADTTERGLRFYEHPSAVIYTYDQGKLIWEDLDSKEKDKELELWIEDR